MKRKLTIYALSTTLLGCAGSYKQPESFESKMARYKSKSAEINKVPDMQVLADASYKKKARRGPASTSKKRDLFTEHTNKKLYFLTLLSQYSNLSKYSSAETVSSINICPSFHSILVDHKDKFEAEGFSRTNKVRVPFEKVISSDTFKDPAKISYYPELMLPVTKENVHPTVAEYLTSNKDANIKEVMTDAINVHLSKTHDELKELCDTGSSSNYYIYENLITHIKKQGFRPGPDNMKTLLKTSIFTNVALIKSFEKTSKKTRGRGIASSNGNKEAYTDAMKGRLGVEWSDSYFDSMTSNR